MSAVRHESLSSWDPVIENKSSGCSQLSPRTNARYAHLPPSITGDNAADDHDHPQHECGIFGVYSHNEHVATTIFFALHALQHRGQEMAGIATSDHHRVHTHKGTGLVSQIFTEEHMKLLTGRLGVGHTRYSTAGGKSLANAQPFVLETDLGRVAVAHNGQLTRQRFLRRLLLSRGTGLFTNSDSEVLAQMLAHPASYNPQRDVTASPLPQSPTPVSPIKSLTRTYSRHRSPQLQQTHSHIPPQPSPSSMSRLSALTTSPSHDDSAIAYNGLVTLHRHSLEPPALITDAWVRRLIDLMSDAEGAYALCVLVDEAVYGCRDRYGIRPLCIGQKDNGNGTMNYALSSESCGFGPIGFTYVREVGAGEIVRLDRTGVHSFIALPGQAKIPRALCIFEYVYFARPDSLLENQLVHSVRQRFGQVLARESPIAADIVAGVPDSSIAAAIGYSAQSGIPFMEVLCKNRYIGRTFIQPDQTMRQNSIRLKFNALHQNLMNKKIVLVDDSIVRGNTLKQLIPLLKQAGAVEVHIRISSPTLRHPCYMGVDIGTYDEILATHLHSVEEMREFIGADSLAFLSLEGMLAAVNEGAKPQMAPQNTTLNGASNGAILSSPPRRRGTVHPDHLTVNGHISEDSDADDAESSNSHNGGHCCACFTGEYILDLDIEDSAHSMNRGRFNLK